MYANFKAQRDGVLESGFLRFFGTAVLHESGPRARRDLCQAAAARADPCRRRAGIGVLIRIDKALDVRGKPIM